jgi:hypothetical protein
MKPDHVVTTFSDNSPKRDTNAPSSRAVHHIVLVDFLMLISLAAVPLALALRKVKLGGAVPVGH